MSEPVGKQLYLKDLNPFVESVSIDDDIYLVRKLSGHVLVMKIDALITGTKPAIEVYWSRRKACKYKLELTKNEVLAVDATTKHRNEMKVFWEIYEPHRLALIKLWESENIKLKKQRKKL